MKTEQHDAQIIPTPPKTRHTQVTVPGPFGDGEPTEVDQGIGTFEVGNQGLVVGDPCHEEVRPGSNILLVAAPGPWSALLIKRAEYDEELVHAELICTYTGALRRARLRDLQEQPFAIAVDSWQIGVFDAGHYHDDSMTMRQDLRASLRTQVDEYRRSIGEKPASPTWYEMCAVTTLYSGAGIIPHGVVSATAYGDGLYEAVAITDSQGIVLGVAVSLLCDMGNALKVILPKKQEPSNTSRRGPMSGSEFIPGGEQKRSISEEARINDHE
ncbi:MAG: hypothetical protein HN341_00885 [Verrucomicrobia bacterium]|jgi:hypothetical protein|nr:hypothetical protein [Verrucomicrobiota bacterium]